MAYGLVQDVLEPSLSLSLFLSVTHYSSAECEMVAVRGSAATLLAAFTAISLEAV